MLERVRSNLPSLYQDLQFVERLGVGGLDVDDVVQHLALLRRYSRDRGVRGVKNNPCLRLVLDGFQLRLRRRSAMRLPRLGVGAFGSVEIVQSHASLLLVGSELLPDLGGGVLSHHR